MLFWIIGCIAIIIIAYIIIKISLASEKNPDSNLGILEHPSTFKKQNIEMVDESLKIDKDED